MKAKFTAKSSKLKSTARGKPKLRKKGANSGFPIRMSSVSRCTFRKQRVTRMTPSAKKTGKTRPSASSRAILQRSAIHSVRRMLKSPKSAAETMRTGEFKSRTKKKPSAMPSNTAWLIASAVIERRRSTRKQPGTPRQSEVLSSPKMMSLILSPFRGGIKMPLM